MRDRGHAIGEGNQGRSLGLRSGNNRSFPRQLDLQTHYHGNFSSTNQMTYIQTNKSTGAEKDQAEVPCANVQGSDHHNGAKQTNGDGAHNMPTVLKHAS